MNKKLIHNIIKSMPGNVFVQDTDGKFLGCNKNLLVVLGLKSERELVGKTDVDFLSKNLAEYVQLVRKKTLHDGLPNSYEIEGKDCEGRFAVYQTHITPLVGENEEPIGILGVSFDITQRKQSENKLQAANQEAQADVERLAKLNAEVTGQSYDSVRKTIEYAEEVRNYLENIIDLMPGHVYWKDCDGKYLGCNTNQARALGLSSRKEIVGKKAYKKLSSEQADRLSQSDQAIIQSGEACITEEPGVLHGGDEGVFLTQKVPLRDKNKKIIGLLGVSFDITQRKQNEDNLLAAQNIAREDHEQLMRLNKEVTGQSDINNKGAIEYAEEVRNYLENIISLMPGHVYWKDLHGRYLGCNDLQAASLGLASRKEIVGKTDYDFNWQNVEQTDKLRSLDQEVVKDNKTVAMEETVLLANGVEATFLSNKVPIHNGSGQVIGLLGISIDITEQKKLQKELEEARIQVKTQEERTKAMQVLGASLAHELRTPLATISNYADTKDFLRELLISYDMAKEAKLPVPFIRPMHIEALGESLEGIQKEATLASKIIDMLLTNLQELAEAEKDYKKHSIVKCVNMAIERYPYVSDAQKELVSFDAANDFIIRAKDLLIMHILFNLMKNAFYYIEQAGKGRIKVHLELGEKVNKLIFTDTGSGIPDEQLPHVFDHFFSKRENGTGVGLTFSRMVMENLGGEMYCESKLGEYATFVMEFPVIA